ncbi:hypothetical protein [Paenibacillus dakarensis]|uniref:hypothetical protein n=1 Tax=Paenibacillus dakarensis TaxID=1527293 RepID=UPI000A771B41|nr:hypothetical protein [Paenibacillus dakarensis]
MDKEIADKATFFRVYLPIVIVLLKKSGADRSVIIILLIILILLELAELKELLEEGD